MSAPTYMDAPPRYAAEPVPMGQAVVAQPGLAYPPPEAPVVKAAPAPTTVPTSVCIKGYRDVNGHTEYEVETRSGDGPPTIVWLRYSAILNFHAASRAPGVFPEPKRLIHTQQVKEERLRALERYLKTAVATDCRGGDLAFGGTQLRSLLLGGAAAPSAAAAAVEPCDATPLLQRIEPSMPTGLCGVLQQACEAFPVRIVVLDNSGSMCTGDGSRIVHDRSGQTRLVKCSRWQELGEDAVRLARVAEAFGNCSNDRLGRTDFVMLNATQGYSTLSVGGTGGASGVVPLPPPGAVPLRQSPGGMSAREAACLLDRSRACVADVERAAKTSPTGSTPLTETVVRVASMIEPAAEALRARGQQVTVVIATDGLPNDPRSFLLAVQQLQRLPVWVVVRLCTDDDAVVNYWNGLDAQLEAPLEVLDDVRGEAEEVRAHNGWLTYGPALHLARLFGLPAKIFDALDEEGLMPAQAKELVEALLGCAALPEPQADRAAFTAELRHAVASAPQTFDPISGRTRPWVDVGALDRSIRDANGEACSIM